MFERYTEKARRTIFFARYEASQLGSPEIDTEHLLLGLLRENKHLFRTSPKIDAEIIRRRIESVSLKGGKISTAIDLPLSAPARRVLKFAADEAERLAHRHIGTEHLLLGLLDEENSLAAKLLREFGADDVELRKKFAAEGSSDQQRGALRAQSPYDSARDRGLRTFPGGIVEIHGARRNADHIRDCVLQLRACNWHWLRKSWKPRDIVIEKKSKQCSFDLTLAADSANFELVPLGWKKDECLICRWELYQSADDPARNTGYTNGHDWLCSECYEKFWQRPDFFSSSQPEIT